MAAANNNDASAEGWTEHSDPASGNKFWFNAASRESSWTRPTLQSLVANSVASSDWTSLIDPNSGNKFYHNARTGESSWSNPDAAGDGGAASVEERAAQLVQSAVADGALSELEVVERLGDWVASRRAELRELGLMQAHTEPDVEPREDDFECGLQPDGFQDCVAKNKSSKHVEDLYKSDPLSALKEQLALLETEYDVEAGRGQPDFEKLSKLKSIISAKSVRILDVNLVFDGWVLQNAEPADLNGLYLRTGSHSHTWHKGYQGSPLVILKSTFWERHKRVKWREVVGDVGDPDPEDEGRLSIQWQDTENSWCSMHVSDDELCVSQNDFTIYEFDEFGISEKEGINEKKVKLIAIDEFNVERVFGDDSKKCLPLYGFAAAVAQDIKDTIRFLQPSLESARVQRDLNKHKALQAWFDMNLMSKVAELVSLQQLADFEIGDAHKYNQAMERVTLAAQALAPQQDYGKGYPTKDLHFNLAPGLLFQVEVLRVAWSRDTNDDLPMDDLCDYFEGFGQIVGTENVSCTYQNTVEVELEFVRDPSAKTLRSGKHVVTRSDDGKQIDVRVSAKWDTRRKAT